MFYQTNMVLNLTKILLCPNKPYDIFGHYFKYSTNNIANAVFTNVLN